MVEVVFAPSQDEGKVKETIHITTDLGETYAATLTAYATVVSPETAEAKPAGEATEIVATPGEPGASAASGAASAVAAQ